MNRVLALILLAVAVGVVSFGISRQMAKSTAPADSLDWMTAEFDLTAQQRADIVKLQTDYAVICERHCAAIANAKDRLAAASAADISQAEADMKRLELVCITSTREHLREVAAQMEPTAGRRFLALVEPKLAGFQHEAPLELP